jgi:hypothetical protein
MGRMLLILILGGSILFSLTSININKGNLSMVENNVDQYNFGAAKNYTESGVEFAISKLAADTSWSGTQNFQLHGGSFSITVENTSSTYFNGPNTGLTSAKLITVIGISGDRADTVRSVIQLPSASGFGPPPAYLQYAVATGNNLHMNGNVTIRDDNNPSINANIHTNADFHMNGNNTIKGFLTYVGEAESNPSHAINNDIVPNQNPDGQASSQRTGAVEIPRFNPDDYKAKADSVFPNNITLSGNISLGTKDNPKVIYVGGDLSIKGNVSGYGEFIVKGNILLNGNVDIASDDPASSSLGLYTAGDLNANGNVTVKAQILTGGNVNLGGNCKVYGSVTAKGSVNFGGNVDIYYRPANGALTKPLEDDSEATNAIVQSRPKILSYY